MRPGWISVATAEKVVERVIADNADDIRRRIAQLHESAENIRHADTRLRIQRKPRIPLRELRRRP